MTDPIQASSSVPLPGYQTLQGTRDPLPVSSPRAIDEDASTRSETDRSARNDAFKQYLDTTSITVAEKTEARRQDAADLIGQTSVYLQPGVTFIV